MSTSGKLVAILNCRAAINDLEDIAIGPGPEKGVDYLYLGDIGDNDERRREIRVVRFAEPDLSGRRGRQLDVTEAEEFRLTYPDGPHDAEAMFVDPVSGDLFVVTKEKERARVYSVAAGQLQDRAAAKLTAAGKLDVDEVSAGAISLDGSRILLRREAPGVAVEPGAGRERWPTALARQPEKVPVLGKRQGPNGESIGFGADRRQLLHGQRRQKAGDLSVRLAVSGGCFRAVVGTSRRSPRRRERYGPLCYSFR